MPFKKRNRRYRFVVLLGLFLSMLYGVEAGAHLLVVDPETFTVPVGSSVRIQTGLAEPLISYVYSRENLLSLGYAGGVANLRGAVHYADATTVALDGAAFLPANAANPASSDHDVASVTIGRAGTVVLATRFEFNSGTRPTVAYAKGLVNWTADGAATKRYGGDEVLEIVQVGDSGPLALGDEITVQVRLRGTPLANATASATYDGAPLPHNPEEGEEENNEYIHKTTDFSGTVRFRLNRAGTWVIAMEFIDEAAPQSDPNHAAYDDWKGIRYRSTLLLPVTDAVAEIDVTDDLIAEDKNGGGIGEMPEVAGLPGWTDSFYDAGFVPAYKYQLLPIAGQVQKVSGKANQPYDYGFRLDLPTADVPAGKTAYAYLGGEDLVLTENDLGEARFAEIVAEVKKIDEDHRYHGVSPGWLILENEEERRFLSKYGLNFVWEYPDGSTRTVTPALQGGIYYADADAKKEIKIAYSLALVDKAPQGETLWSELAYDMGRGEQFLPILFDGANDGRLAGAVWLTLDDEENSSSGCAAGFGVFALGAALSACLLSRGKRSGK